MEHPWSDTDSKTPKYSEKKPTPILLSPPCGLSWDWSRVSTMIGRQLTAWARTRSLFSYSVSTKEVM